MTETNGMLTLTSTSASAPLELHIVTKTLNDFGDIYSKDGGVRTAFNGRINLPVIRVTRKKCGQRGGRTIN
jgi:hypothetical protein